MSNDELLSKIEWIRTEFLPETTSELAWERLADATRALRAVVELHKPRKNTWPISGIPPISCNECEDGFANYPCPTIQAIEKELK